jgi:hypothetical protein
VDRLCEWPLRAWQPSAIGKRRVRLFYSVSCSRRVFVHPIGVYDSSVDQEIQNYFHEQTHQHVLPDATVAVVDRVATKGSRSRFIDRAVRHYVETQGRESLREQLKAGYRASDERSLAMAAEWFPLEEEAGATSEAPRKRTKTTKAKQA